MTREELLDLYCALTDKAYELLKDKNHDYAAGDDPFRNFRRNGLAGITTRMGDKLTRLESLIDNKGELAVKGETVEDTCLDIINYAVIFYGYMLASGVGDLTRKVLMGRADA